MSKVSKIKQIVAIIPCYHNGADASKVYYANQEVKVYPKKAKVFVNEMAEFHGICISVFRKSIDGGFGRLQPLFINDIQTFIPLKVRTETLGKDGKYGYFNYSLHRESNFYQESKNETIIDLFPDELQYSTKPLQEGTKICPIKISASYMKVRQAISNGYNLHMQKIYNR